MSRRKAKELPGSIQHLPAYIPPGPDRVTHDAIWRRALARHQPGTTVRVTFPPEQHRG